MSVYSNSSYQAYNKKSFGVYSSQNPFLNNDNQKKEISQTLHSYFDNTRAKIEINLVENVQKKVEPFFSNQQFQLQESLNTLLNIVDSYIQECDVEKLMEKIQKEEQIIKDNFNSVNNRCENYCFQFSQVNSFKTLNNDEIDGAIKAIDTIMNLIKNKDNIENIEKTDCCFTNQINYKMEQINNHTENDREKAKVDIKIYEDMVNKVEMCLEKIKKSNNFCNYRNNIRNENSVKENLNLNLNNDLNKSNQNITDNFRNDNYYFKLFKQVKNSSRLNFY